MVHGYKCQRAFVIAQTPLPSTVGNFWKLLYDRKVAGVVQLTGLSEGGREVCAQYWPSQLQEEVNHGGYVVELMDEKQLEGYAVRTLSLSKETVSILYMGNSKTHMWLLVCMLQTETVNMCHKTYILCYLAVEI